MKTTKLAFAMFAALLVVGAASLMAVVQNQAHAVQSEHQPRGLCNGGNGERHGEENEENHNPHGDPCNDDRHH
jgi:hypothetical protein